MVLELIEQRPSRLSQHKPSISTLSKEKRTKRGESGVASRVRIASRRIPSGYCKSSRPLTLALTYVFNAILWNTATQHYTANFSSTYNADQRNQEYICLLEPRNRLVSLSVRCPCSVPLCRFATAIHAYSLGLGQSRAMWPSSPQL